MEEKPKNIPDQSGSGNQGGSQQGSSGQQSGQNVSTEPTRNTNDRFSDNKGAGNVKIEKKDSEQ